MIIRKYKNQNITLKLERGETLESVGELVEYLANSIELDFIECFDICCAGNDYAYYPINIGWNEYHIGPDELETLQAGYTVRLYKLDDVPRLTIPTHYDAVPFELDGVRGTLYKLCNRLKPFQVEELEAVPGVFVLRSTAQYAPELEHFVLFVPNGIVRAFW